MTNDPRTVTAALDRFAHQLPDHDALRTDDRSFTAAALRDEVRRAAAALIALDVRAGDRVAVWSPNTWHWVVACLAIHHAGAAMMPLNTRYTASEASDIVARTYTRDHLANFKAPRSVRFVDELPRNAGGKVLKPQLRELA